MEMWLIDPDGEMSRTPTQPESYQNSSPRTGLSSDEPAGLGGINLKHGWNACYGIPHHAVEESATRADHGDGDEEAEHREREKIRERRQRSVNRKRNIPQEHREAAFVPAAENVEIDAGQYAREGYPYKQYRTNGMRSGGVRRLEGGSEDYREKDKWRDETRTRNGSDDPKFDLYERKRKRRRHICIGVCIFLLLLVIIIPVAVVYSRKKSSESGSSGSGGGNGGSSGPPNDNLHNISPSSIPKWAKGGYLDPFDWYDTLDFNVTFTAEKVGGLYVMGLNSTWDDSTRANKNVPRLNEPWKYGKMPFREINLGGLLSIEPFITPSLFSKYGISEGVVDEWTFSQHFGPHEAKSTLEKHYSAWAQEPTFAEIADARFDHIRIPFSYWAVTTYKGDPYVLMVSWRYLLRGIEWAGKYGLRVYLDLHGAPGSQNGWNHSGHQGTIGWLNGTDGDLNGQRTISIHKQLSTFFSQPRYKNIITMYGLVNEPKMIALPLDKVLDWSKEAITAIRNKGYAGLIVIGDGFLGLQHWQGKMRGIEGLILEDHQYAIFDIGLLALDHYDKINFACGGWTQQAKNSINTATGFGPTMFGEWSQADTDCTQYLNAVGVGSRWEGTLDMANSPGGATTGSILKPQCPADGKSKCSCAKANTDVSSYSDEYKKWLLTFAEAQMDSFEVGWGWFYWTWKTESAPQWSYKDRMAAGILPKVAYKRSWNCDMSIPDFESGGLPEGY